MSKQNQPESVIIKDVHCPYCNNEGAVMLNKITSKKISLQFPAYGLRFMFSFLYLSIVHMFRYGLKLFEAVKVIDSISYAFCPHCGNSYSLGAPDQIKDEVEEPRFYREKDGKVIMGMCTGVSAYTGIPLLWVRLMTVIYSMMVIGLLVYFLVGACVSFRDEADKPMGDKKLMRIRKGKDIAGVCTGLSAYTDIPLVWVRLMMCVVGFMFYPILWVVLPVKEDAENHIQKKKLCKKKEKKWLLGVCSGFAAHTGWPLWLVRVLTVVTFIPANCYLILAAVIPNETVEE